MFKSKSLRNYFSRNEKILWCTSVILIVISFFIFDRVNYLTLAASLIGVTSLIFDAKGNPFGQLLMVIFSVLYGIISYSFSYYGEMATYLGMTAPMSIFALISWIKNTQRQSIRSRNCYFKQERYRSYAVFNNDCHCDFLFFAACVPHGKPCTQHAFCYDKFSCRLLNV